ncbi:hypothetical protein SDC9_187903 [bioreactor metagenome]|uniref:Uncharacterized protein n=1 Tax=bioreactor metagenome TaxID=1076179 RepID=A0A645HN36_9ZZZZ
MIHKYVLRGDALLYGICLHGVDLVIFILTVVAAHEQAVGAACLIGGDTGDNTIFQYAAWLSAVPDARAKYENCIRFERRGLVRL